MKYWAYVNDQVKGPFEKDDLRAHPDFRLAMLVCPESPDGGQAGEWKEAASFPDLAAAKQTAPAAESPLAMTMRGTLIMPQEDAAPNVAAPAPASAPAPAAAAVSRAVAAPPAAQPGAPGLEPEPTLAQLRNKLDQLGAMLLTISNGQDQLAGKVAGIEAALAGMRGMLMPPPPKK